MVKVDEIYESFISKVAFGRDGLKKSDVHNVAMGRVWSGKEALDLELVDEIGDLQSAIKFAANKVGLEKTEIKLVHYPKIENDELLQILSSLDLETKSSSEIMNYVKNINNNFNSLIKNRSIEDKFQTIFPFEIRIF